MQPAAGWYSVNLYHTVQCRTCLTVLFSYYYSLGWVPSALNHCRSLEQFFTGQELFLMPSRQCEYTKRKSEHWPVKVIPADLDLLDRPTATVAIQHLQSADTGTLFVPRTTTTLHGNEVFCGRGPTHLEQSASFPSNRNALAFGVRSTFQDPPVWLGLTVCLRTI